MKWLFLLCTLIWGVILVAKMLNGQNIEASLTIMLLYMILVKLEFTE